MYFSTVLALIGTSRLALAHPLSSRNVASFPAGSSWDILLNSGGNMANVKPAVSQNYQAIDIDLFDTDNQTIADLKATKQVICYFSAGSREEWRSDANQFQNDDYGKAMEGWEGENWVNVKSENVRNIMKNRIKLAATVGCAAVDPDNVDGFGDNQDGFGYDKSAYVDYIKFLAQEAKSNNLAIGLKNAAAIIPDVVDVVQFAVNEECHEYNECDKYKPFTAANKAVFNVEYGGNACNSPPGVKLSTLVKSKQLDTLGGACSNQGAPSNPANTQQPAPTAAPSNGGAAPIPTKTSALQPTPTKTLAPQPTPTNPDDEEDNKEGDGEEEEEEKEEEEEGDEDDDEENVPTTTSTAKPTKGWHPRPTGGYYGRKPWKHNGGKH